MRFAFEEWMGEFKEGKFEEVGTWYSVVPRMYVVGIEGGIHGSARF